MNAIGYIRVSTNGQAENGFGLAAQQKAVRQLARERGYRLLKVVRDEGVSGLIEVRPGLADLLEALRTGMVVLVPGLDRLARDLLTQEILLRDIRQRGADVVSCSPAETENLLDDPNDPTRKLIRQVLGAVAEFERSLVRLRLQRGRALKAERGGFAYGSPPYGTRSVAGRLVPLPDEVDAIVFARKLRTAGKSLRKIAEALHEKGYRPKRSDRWHPATVARVLARGA